MTKSPNHAANPVNPDISVDTSSLKSIYTRNKTRIITSDFFLFSCAEEEHNLKSIPEAYKHFQRYPLFQDSTGLEKIRSTPLAELLPEFFSWYESNYPQLTNPEEITYLRFGTTLSECTLFLHEMTDLLRLNLNNQIPPRTKEHNKEDPIWNLVDGELAKHLPSYAPFMQSYFQWVFRRNAKLDYDLGSLPPTGRFLFLLKRGSSARPSPSTTSNSNSTPRPKREQTPPATHSPQESASEEPTVEDFAALAEVDAALAQLVADHTLESVNLKPQNSFLRRKQHKHVIAQEGFESLSIGEGDERALQVRRSSGT